MANANTSTNDPNFELNPNELSTLSINTNASHTDNNNFVPKVASEQEQQPSAKAVSNGQTFPSNRLSHTDTAIPVINGTLSPIAQSSNDRELWKVCYSHCLTFDITTGTYILCFSLIKTEASFLHYFFGH